MPAHIINNSFQFIDANGLPVVGGKVETYEPNGSSTPKPLYSDKALTTSVGAVQTLNSLGMFSAELFGDGDYYIIVKYADATTAYDMEYIEGEGSGNNAATEWEASVTPTFISTTSFSVAGDLTSDFHVNRRVKTENTGGTVYGTITASAFTTLTTITIENDSGVLDSGLSSVDLAFLRADNSSMPEISVIQESSATPVNKVKITSADTGSGPTIEAIGSDTDVGVSLKAQGDGIVDVDIKAAVVRNNASTNVSAFTYIPWAFLEYKDIDSMHDIAVNNDRLTVPAGVTRVRLLLQLNITGGTSAASLFAQVQKNTDLFNVVGFPEVHLDFTSGTGKGGGISTILNVTAGDYFRVYARYTATGTPVVNQESFFSMEIIK